jgi:hypothetical protein
LPRPFSSKRVELVLPDSTSGARFDSTTLPAKTLSSAEGKSWTPTSLNESRLPEKRFPEEPSIWSPRPLSSTRLSSNREPSHSFSESPTDETPRLLSNRLPEISTRRLFMTFAPTEQPRNVFPRIVASSENMSCRPYRDPETTLSSTRERGEYWR